MYCALMWVLTCGLLPSEDAAERQPALAAVVHADPATPGRHSEVSFELFGLTFSLGESQPSTTLDERHLTLPDHYDIRSSF